MDVLNEAKLTAAANSIESQAVKDIVGQVIPLLGTTVNEIVSTTMTNLQATLGDFVQALVALETETLNDLDGWTLELSPITIKLKRPIK